MVASRLANMQHGGDRKSEDFNTEISVLISQPEAAAMLNVSTDSVQFAKKVLDQGSEELISKVARRLCHAKSQYDAGFSLKIWEKLSSQVRPLLFACVQFFINTQIKPA